jgi:hypothetical protein
MNLKPILGKRFLKRRKLSGLIIGMHEKCKEFDFGLFYQRMRRRCL